MYYFIVNPNARRGRGLKVWNKLEKQLKKANWEYKVWITNKPQDAKCFAWEITSECKEPKTIIGVGGTGLMNEILNGLVFDAPVTLGYIPAGAGNDLANSLRISKNPKVCLKRILHPRYKLWMDYGVVSYGDDERNHRRFLVSSGIGVDGAVFHELMDIRGRMAPPLINPGRLSYVLLLMKQMLSAKPVKGYLLLDGTKRVELTSAYQISTHIHPSEGGGFRLAPMAEYNDGNLEVCVIQASSKLKFCCAMIDVILGRMRHNHRGVRFYQCREVQIHVEKPEPVHADGESCFCQTDIYLRCIEKKIRMIV